MKTATSGFGSMLRWMTVGLVLCLAAASRAETRLTTDPPSNSPIPRCVANGGSAQSDALSVMRTGCDVLAFSSGCKHGYVRPCEDDDVDCDADGNGNACHKSDRLWLCFGVQCQR